MVPSQSSPSKKYAVKVLGDEGQCECPDFEMRLQSCKHLLAVRYIIEHQQNPDGSTTVTETFEVTKRTTYPQKWAEYNQAQTTEKDYLQALLHGLCEGVTTPAQSGRGQRKLPLADAIFAFQREWVKVHIMTCVKTNVVTAVEIGDKHANDNKMLPALVETTAQVSRCPRYRPTKPI